MRKPFRVTEAMRSRDRITAALGYANAGVAKEIYTWLEERAQERASHVYAEY